MHEQAGLNDVPGDGTDPAAITAPADVPFVEFDADLKVAAAHLEAARHGIEALQITLAVWPERAALVDEHTRELCSALGHAFEAYARFRVHHDFLTGMLPVNPS